MGPATVAGHPKRDLAKNRTPHGTRDIAVQFPCQGYHTRMGAAGAAEADPKHGCALAPPKAGAAALASSLTHNLSKHARVLSTRSPRKDETTMEP